VSLERVTVNSPIDPQRAAKLFKRPDFSSAAQPPNDVVRQDELFASWEQAQRTIRSLVVEFSFERSDPNFGETEKCAGTVRLIRTPKGELFGSYELGEKQKTGGRRLWNGLLNGGLVYLLDYDKKRAMKFDPASSDLRGFLEKYFSPFVVLLDRKHAEKNCRLQVIKQDEWYTYLSVTPKQLKRSGWLSGRAVFMNQDSEGVPKNMPRQLWYQEPSGQEYKFNIKAWRLNAADAPKLEEFQRPEDRPGWLVYFPWWWSPTGFRSP
jgi:hypothetical protein